MVANGLNHLNPVVDPGDVEKKTMIAKARTNNKSDKNNTFLF
jgi:hypothetical protein